MGRQREFDVDEALDAVLCVFWRKGYEGASYTDLTQAAGVERPALYAAFGNKEAMFRKALARYSERYGSFVPQALAMPTARAVAQALLDGAIDLHTRFPEHNGCLGVNGAMAGSDDAESVRQALIAWRAQGQVQLTQRLERAQQEGDLPASANPSTLAIYLMAVLHGLAVQAKAGFTREMQQAVAQQAMAGWPQAEVPAAT